MNWNAIGAIAELVGAAGVVVTLLYLAVQVRQNTKALRAATFQNIIGFATGFAERVAGSGEFAAIFETGMADLEALDESERLRFHFLLIALLRRFENIHYQSRMGLIDDEEWEGLRAALHSIMFRPGSRAWWKVNAHLFNSSFREFLDGRLAANDAQGASVTSPPMPGRVAANARETP